MNVFMQLLIVCPLVFLSGFVDSIAGGGGLISIPAYMLAGFPVHYAIGTNKLSSAMGTILTTYKFARKGFIKLNQVVFTIIFACLGSSIGARIALLTDDKIFKILMLFILPVTAFYVFKTKNLEVKEEAYSKKKTILISLPISFFVGMYDGFYGPGTGTFLILLLTGVARLSLNESAGITKAINLTTNLTALTIFFINGKVLVPIGLIVGVFSILGNYLGSKVFISKGSKSVRPIILVVLVLFYIKIIGEFL